MNTIPTSWSEVTIGQYQKMTSIISKQLTDVEQRIELALLFMGQEANKLTLKQLKAETDKLSFISELPSEKMAYGFELDGRKFNVNVIAQKLTAGQYIDLTSLIKKPEDTINNLHKIMAVLATDGEYVGYLNNSKLFQERLTIDKVYPASAFFLKVFQGLTEAMKAYTVRETKKMIRQAKKLNKELNTKHSTNTGVGL